MTTHRNGAVRLLIVLSLACGLVFAADVPTAQYDTNRTSWNPSEIYLSAANVNSTTFGKLYTRALDGWVYAQPLYLQSLAIPGHGSPNVVIVCTANNTVYAFDADSAAVSAPYWSTNLGPADTTPNNPPASPNSEPSLGIISTPVIVRSLSAIFVTAATRENGHRVYRLHSLDITTGKENTNSPVVIAGQVSGTASDAQNGILTFNPDLHLQRASLAVAGNNVFIGTAGSRDTPPFHGWVFTYDLSSLKQTGILNLTSGGNFGGVWQSMRAPVVDSAGNVYFETGNGDYDGVFNFGDSVVKLTGSSNGISVTDWFTPDNWPYLAGNLDLSAAGPLLVPGTPYLIAAGKDGTLYVLNSGNMGQLQAGDVQIVQQMQIEPDCAVSACDYTTNDPIFWNNAASPALYVWPWSDVLRSYSWTGGKLSTSAASTGNLLSGYPGGYLTGSSYGSVAGTGIVWALTGDNQDTQAATLHAFDATNVATELWNSNLNSTRDAAGSFAKNVPPLVANGKVYVGNFSAQLIVYGLLNGPVPADVNADGKVDCSDVAIVQASFNKKSTDPGFDARADVVQDNIINIRDLAFVSQHLARGTVCK